ncbi:MAG: hypothetical protein QOD93_84 [Acetobacteraceae bacterium]|jgi:hypothetical protein|nr:hypothetical protein [Acetobacteraceae bacterium]MEA2767122.1 hypothetical protein [Acetobacteraceae bacterium]
MTEWVMSVVGDRPCPLSCQRAAFDHQLQVSPVQPFSSYSDMH